jgi:hypothetical protein
MNVVELGKETTIYTKKAHTLLPQTAICDPNGME